MDIFNYFVFVIVPVFGLGFQALLLPVLFFLKARSWLRSYAFAIAGCVVGIGFGYGFADVGGAQEALAAVIGSVALFGAVSGLCWWYVLVKRLEPDVDPS
jgi:hypothetical protein